MNFQQRIQIAEPQNSIQNNPCDAINKKTKYYFKIQCYSKVEAKTFECIW